MLGFDLSSNAVAKLLKAKQAKVNEDATIAQWTSSLSSKLKIVKMIQQS